MFDISKTWNRLSFRFPLLIVLFLLLGSITVGAIAINIANDSLIQSYMERMEVLRDERSRAVIAELQGKADLLKTLTISSTSTVTGFRRVQDAFHAMDAASKAAVIKAYTEDNPFPTGNRGAVNDAGDGSAYSEVHKLIHPQNNSRAILNHFYDMMFVDLNGDIIYSVQKENDFGANILNGPLREEATGRIFRKVLSQVPPWEVVFSDLARYPPSGSKPTLFLGSALQDITGTIIGVVIIQLNTDILSNAANNVKDLSETGEVYLVGADLLARSNTRFLKDAALEKTMEGYSARRAIAGSTGAEATIDYAGKSVVSAYAPLDILGVRWGIVAKIGMSEVQAPLRQMAVLIVAGTLVSVIVLGFVGVTVTRSVSRPLARAVAVMRDLTAGHRGVDISFESNLDVVRAIGAGLQTFKEELTKNDSLMNDVRQSQAQITELLDTSPVGTMVITAGDEVLFVNEPGAMILGSRKTALIGAKFSFGAVARFPHDWNALAQRALREGFVKDAELQIRIAEKGEVILDLSLRRTTYGGRDGLLIWFQDVTGQRQANEELRNLNERFVAFLENTPDFVTIRDPAGRFQAVSQSFAENYTDLKSWRDLLGKMPTEVFPPAIAAALEEKSNEFLASGSLLNESEENFVLHGKKLRLSMRRIAVRSGGRNFGTLTIARDVTKEREAEAAVQVALSESKAERQRSQTILDSSPDPVVIVRKNGIIDYVSKQGVEMFGYAANELIGQSIERLVPARIRPNHASHVKHFFNAGQARQMGGGRELFAVAKDGREIPVEISLSPMTNGDESLVIASVRDISERIATQQVLKENEKRFRSLFDSSRDALIITHAGKYIDCNAAALTLFGLSSREELNDVPAGSLAPEFQPSGVRSTEYAKQMFQKAEAEGTSHFEWIMRQQSGKLIPVEILITKVELGGKQVLYSSVRDITTRKTAEEALNRAKDAAEAATKAKGDFLASMSHEIRTPMNGIIGMADLMAQSPLDDDQKHMLKTIRESGNALVTIINDILDFSKIEAGKLDFENLSMSVADVLEGVAATLTPNATKKSIRINTFVDPAIPAAVQGDPVRVRQVLFNLTGNAVKFSEKKDVAVRAEVARTDADGRLWVRFKVIDQGIGISEENQAKLFQAFSQAESSTTRKFGGTGLGLAICKRLAELMDGTVGLTSKVGEGSTFIAEIPFLPTDKTRSKEKPRDLHGLRVVLVGSAGLRQEAILSYLTHWGAEAVRAVDDRAAVDLVKDAEKEGSPISSVMLDLGLNAEEQDHAVKRFRKALPKRKTPLILLQDYQMRGARIKEEDVVTMDANPLIRYRLITAVAVAAGRASPEVKPETDTVETKPGKAPTVDEALARGELILLAEDNLTNQDVIRRQLARLGYACEIANNGVEAVKALGTGRYALLLTDCHMPEMDGYDLSGAIRKDEKSTGKRLPIIAVTANALQGEAERCIAAGMDDYISKPIAMPALRAALQKWMPVSSKQAAANETPAVVPDAPTDASPVIDDRAIKDMFGDDDVTFKEILDSFVAPSEATVVEIVTAWEKRSAVGVKDAAHKLKSAARSVGANGLADTSTELEAAGKSGDWGTIDKLVPRARAQMAAVARYINTL